MPVVCSLPSNITQFESENFSRDESCSCEIETLIRENEQVSRISLWQRRGAHPSSARAQWQLEWRRPSTPPPPQSGSTEQQSSSHTAVHVRPRPSRRELAGMNRRMSNRARAFRQHLGTLACMHVWAYLAWARVPVLAPVAVPAAVVRPPRRAASMLSVIGPTILYFFENWIVRGGFLPYGVSGPRRRPSTAAAVCTITRLRAA